jgi:hypothetical protein
MNRFPMQGRALLVVLLGLTVCGAFSGCQGLLVTAYYFINGTDDAAEYNGLKEKKVVVVCRPLVAVHYRNQNVARDLSQQVSVLLKEKVKKIKVVDQRKVNKWCDENSWEEYAAVGKALKADMVVGIDIESFTIYQGQTLYQGNASSTVHVFDCKEGDKEVFAKQMPQTVYPPSTGIATSERHEDEFRAEFVKVLASRVARHFYAHDAFDDVALDAQALK